MSHWSDALTDLGACSDAVEWAATQPDLQTAWDCCARGDWMLWLAGRRSEKETPERKLVVRAAAECARLALPHFERSYPNDQRPRIAIETAIAYSEGRATLDEVLAAAAAAAADAAAALAECAKIVRGIIPTAPPSR